MSRHYIYRMEIAENNQYHGIYIGQHKMGAKAPIFDGYKGSGCKWRKYILGNHIPVTKTVLLICDSIEEANYWEEYYINQAKEAGEYLWNVAKGGGGHEADHKLTMEELKAHNAERCRLWYEANKERHAEYGRQYRRNNKERCDAVKRKYAEEHREEYKEYHKQYYLDNKEKFSEKSKQNYQKNKECINEHNKEYFKQYAKNHAEQLREKGRRYYEANKEKHKQYYSRLCSYNGETLTINALSLRFKRQNIPNPMQQAKLYLINKGG